MTGPNVENQPRVLTLVEMILFILLPLAVALALGKYFYRFVGWPALIPAWIILCGVGLLQVTWAVRGFMTLFGRRNQKPREQ